MLPRSEQLRVGDRGPRLHALHWGAAGAPLVVLLHGGGANAHWWDHVAPALAAGRHVVALDFRGHGDSDRPDDLRPGAFDEDLRALLEHVGAGDCVLVGHSMGAHVALARAADDPPRGLVLLDPSRGSEKRRSRRLRLALSFRRSYATREEAVERFRFLPDAEHAADALRRAIARHSVEELPDGRFGYKFDSRWFGLPPAERPDPARVACPTLVVRGEESEILSDEGARALCDELPRARLAVVAGAGHHVQIDRPDAVIELLLGFLAELEAGRDARTA
ncbi:MAG: alpha/beta hydrolase [Myxococcota bacterium]